MQISLKPGNVQFYRKAYAVIIIGMIFISFQNLIGLDQVVGDVKEDGEGNLLIDSGSVHEINMAGSTYQQQGNITIDGSGSKLLIRNTTMKFLKGSGFRYHIEVKNGGTLEIVNSMITVDVSAGGSEENINIIVNQGTLDMDNGTLRVPGDLTATSSSIDLTDSVIEMNPSGSLKSSVVMNLTDSNVVLKDSSVLDIATSEHIYLRGTTNFIAINSFLNLTGSHKLHLFDSTRAMLYALDAADKNENSIIAVSSASAYAEIFRLLTLNVYDETDVPVGSAKVTPRNFSNQELVPPPGADILNYLGKTAGNYNVTNYLGTVILPLRSDNITNTGADYVGNYQLDVDISTYHTDGGYSLKPFPNFYTQYNKPSFTLKFSSLIPPDINGHYSKSLPALKITSTVLFNSPLQLQQNLIIDGGTLTILNTRLEMNQTKIERFYVLLKNGGKLILDRSVMNDPAGWPLNVYVQGASQISVKASTFDLGSGILNLRSGSSLEMNASTMKGSINSMGPNNELKINDASTLSSTKIQLEDTIVNLRDVKITTGSITTKKLELYAVNTTFNKKLTFESSTMANLTNVTFPGVSAPHIAIADNSEVNIFWWLSVRVVDGGNNLLEKAIVHLFNYTVSGQKKLYAEGETEASGRALFEVFSEKRNASGSFKGIERNYYMNATYRNAKSNSAGTSPLTSNKEIELEFDLAADLYLISQSIVGNLFADNILKLNATIKNIGDFDLNTTQIPIRFYVDGKQLGNDVVLNQLSVDQSAEVSKDWQAAMGTHIINITVDPGDVIGEKNETNNKATEIVTISVGGPDLGITASDIQFDPSVPSENANMTISVKVKNFGGYDPADNGDQITVKFYLNDPDIGGTQIGTVQYIDSIPPTTSKTVATNWTVGVVGNYNIYAIVETPFDGNTGNNKANRTLMIHTLPDLYISSTDISFLPSEKLIHESPVFIRAVVYNIGGTAVDNVGVAFYDGDPAAGGTQIGFNTSIVPIAPNGGTVIVQIQWTPLNLGTHQIFVKIDPNEMVTEAKTINNIANRTIEVLSKPNLYLTTDDIGFSSSTITEGNKLTVQALIHNDGEVAVSNVIVKISLNSLSNPSIVPDLEISSIPANGIFNLQVDWLNARPNGTHNIYIWIDPDNDIPESDDLDNHASRTIVITKTIDLRLGSDDIMLNNLTTLTEVGFGKTLNIKAQVWNDGGSPTKTQFIVQFFLSDPAGDRKLGGDIPITTVEAGNFVEVEVNWPANLSGNQMLIVLVDPQGLVADSNVANNKAFKEFTVQEPPDLSIEEGEIMFSTGEFVQTGKVVTITAVVLNLGGTDWSDVEVTFYEGDPYDPLNGSDQIGQVVMIDDIESLGRVPVSRDWTTGAEGVFEIFMVIDYKENIPDPDRDNNIASGTLEVLSFAPDLYIDSIEHSPKYVMVGNVVRINVTLGNIGNTFADQVVVEIYESFFGSTQELVSAITFPNLTAKSTFTMRYDWSGAGVAGDYELYFEIDPNNGYKEFNERNNSYVHAIEVKTEPPKADLLFDSSTGKKVILDPPEPRSNEYAKIQVIVRNAGDLSAGSFEIELRVGERFISNKTVEGLAVQDVEVLDFTWKPLTEGPHTIYIDIDPAGLIEEISDDNNRVEHNIVVVKGAAPVEEDISGMAGWALAAMVIIVALVAVMLIFVIKRRKATDWAECSECGEKMPLDSTVCPNCGTEFSEEMECGECHSLISVNDTACPNCGAAFTEETPEEKKKKGLFGFGEGKDDEDKDGGDEGDEVEPKESESEDKPPDDDDISVTRELSEATRDEGDEDKDKPEELDDEEFQEFERELDEDLDEGTGSDDESELELSDSKKPLDDFDLEKESDKSDTPVPTPKVAEDGQDSTDNDKDSSDKKDDDAKKSDEKVKDEDKDDFIIPGAQWTAECYKCNARIPLSASLCPECGAEFE